MGSPRRLHDGRHDPDPYANDGDRIGEIGMIVAGTDDEESLLSCCTEGGSWPK